VCPHHRPILPGKICRSAKTAEPDTLPQSKHRQSRAPIASPYPVIRQPFTSLPSTSRHPHIPTSRLGPHPAMEELAPPMLGAVFPSSPSTHPARATWR
jgi:hypothetical protein